MDLEGSEEVFFDADEVEELSVVAEASKCSDPRRLG